MTLRQDVASYHEIAARWGALAERRLQYLVEMFETGRWRRYHSEAEFLENLNEAERATQVWRALAVRDVPAPRWMETASLGGRAPSRSAVSREDVQTRLPKSVAAETSFPVWLASPPDGRSTTTRDSMAEVEQPASAMLRQVNEFISKLDGIQALLPRNEL